VTSIGDGAFKGCTELTIYAAADKKPEGWQENLSQGSVIWGAALDIPAVNDELKNLQSDITEATEELISGNLEGINKKLEGISSTVTDYVQDTLATNLTEYAKKSELPTVPTKVSTFTNDANYQTFKQVEESINVATGGVEAAAVNRDLSSYKETNNSRVAAIEVAIEAASTSHATKSELAAVENKIPTVNTETWLFTLEDGTTIAKKVHIV
jgi:hypothetical protein